MPPAGGTPHVQRVETTGKAIRRLIGRLGGPDGLAVAYEAGPGGFDRLRLLTKIGVRCDVIAPSPLPSVPAIGPTGACDARSHALSEHVDGGSTISKT